jgi:hypothetical protein
MKFLLIILFFVTVNSFGQDTLYGTYQVKHDTLESTHVDAKYIPHHTTATSLDSQHSDFLNTRYFITVGGMYSYDSVYYDTIAAYDTTFICHLCAVHDTTVIVIVPDTTTINYGVFIINNPQTSFPSRIHQAKSIIGNNTMRDNYNRGENGYNVKRIQDSGLLCAMTVNNRPVQDVTYFPTGPALTAFIVTLDSLLDIRKPDILFIENEEGKAEYHKGNVTDYLAELNAAVTVAHDHGVPIGNGGTTQGVVFALRKWYRDRGRLDSIAWINDAASLNPNENASYAQQQLGWYLPLLAGFATSQMDYVNFHWYEPPRTDTTPVVTSKIVPPLINFLRVTTGHPVVTNEAGGRNSSTPLLIEMFDEIKNAGCPWIIYFDGTGDGLAVQNEAGWQAFLLQ